MVGYEVSFQASRTVIRHMTVDSVRHYSLEVVQHPLRARMCGFGDKVSDSWITQYPG